MFEIEKDDTPRSVVGRGIEARRYAWADEKWRERRLASWHKRVKQDELHKFEEYYRLLPVQDLPF